MYAETATRGIDYVFLDSQLAQNFSKIKIVDDSIDKSGLHKKIKNYYHKKWSSYDLAKSDCTFIDLFCGAGGLSVGLEQVGLHPIIAIDKDLSATSTYRFNRPWMQAEDIVNDDIKKIDKKRFPYAPIIVGGPPCQGFSVVNKHKKESDERNELYKFYVETVKSVQPEIFLMENVEGMLQLYYRIAEDFAAINYTACSPLIYSPKDFGFPQSRKRTFILGINNKYKNTNELFEIFKKSINEHLSKTVYTLWDAISDLPEIEAKTAKNATYSESQIWGYTFADLSKPKTKYAKLVNFDTKEAIPLLNHRSKYNNDRDIQIYGLLKQGEKSDAESISAINPYKSRAEIFRDKFDKLKADEPCKAITAHMYYDCNMYIHPYQARGLSPREAARVQGFPDDYLFLGSPNEWYRQIGNAVSPLVARVLGDGLKNVLERIKSL